MRLEIADNNDCKYIRIVESVRVENSVTKKKSTRKKIIKNIGPVSRYDDGKPDFIERLKASYAAGTPIIDELVPYVSKNIKKEVYNIQLHEGTDECVSHPKLMASSVFEKLFEELDLSQLIRTYKNKYNCDFDVYGFFKTLVFGRILNPASKISTVSQVNDYFVPTIRGNYNQFDVYDALDFIYEHKSAIFNRINTNMVKKFGRTTNYVYYDVTNFFFEIDEADDGDSGFRRNGVSKEERSLPIVQMGLLMDEQGCPISIEVFPGNTLDHQTLRKSFENSVNGLGNSQNRYIYVCDKGIGKGDSLRYAIENGNGYITSKTVRGSTKEDIKWILDNEGYVSEGNDFKYKSRIIKKKIQTSDGVALDTTEKQVTYWSRKFFEREKHEKKSFYELVEKLIESPEKFRISKLQNGLVSKYVKKELINGKTGEVIDSDELKAQLDMEKLMQDYKLMGYYTIVTSETSMSDKEVINTYKNLVEIEDQFRVMKSTLDTRPVFVRTKEHIIAHLTVCTVALLLIRLIQRQITLYMSKSGYKSEKLYESGLSANRIQNAMNKWTVDRIGDQYYRFANIDDPDLKLILDAFGIVIPPKCFTLAELKHLKFVAKMSP